MRGHNETRSQRNGRANLKGPGRFASYGFSIGSERLRTEVAAACALALRRRRLSGTHCLQVTRCHGGGTLPRTPVRAQTQPQRARPSVEDST